jgi:hypothetical protein
LQRRRKPTRRNGECGQDGSTTRCQQAEQQAGERSHTDRTIGMMVYRIVRGARGLARLALEAVDSDARVK